MANNICLVVDKNKPFEIHTLFGEEKVYSKDGVVIAALGNIYGDDRNRIALEDIFKLYTMYSNDVNKHLDGTYSVMIFDTNLGKGYVYQDRFGFNQAIYYYQQDGKIIISNQLKSIVRNHKNTWKLNQKAVKEFLLRGYCGDRNTLIDGIYKIPGRFYLYIDIAKAAVKIVKTKKVKAPKREITPQIYDEVVERQCVTCAHERLATTVSSGYDSNYILHFLNKDFERDITGFCIGGTIGRNEIPDAEKICEGYKKVNLFTKLVDGSSLNKFPEIVYALEGAIYESGIFLQYELAKLTSSYGCENIILGECADQVLNFEMYHPYGQFKNQMKYTMQRLPGRVLKEIYFKPYKKVYDMASYIVIKKNGIMMNYFGVTPEYPYMRKEFYETAENAVKAGERRKEYHKMVINSVLPEYITNILKKIGGATELKTLFIGDIKLDDIQKACQTSAFYVPKTFDDQFYAIDYLMKIVYLELFKKIFIEQSDKYLTDSFGDYDLKYFLLQMNNN